MRARRNIIPKCAQEIPDQTIIELADLMDARLLINGLEAKLERLEEKLEEGKREIISWIHRAEKFKAERYQAFSYTIDPVTPPPPHAIEWGILVRKPEVWAGVVGLVTLLAAMYAAGRYQGDDSPAVSSLPSSKQDSFTHLIFMPDAVVLPAANSVTEDPEG